VSVVPSVVLTSKMWLSRQKAAVLL